MQAAVREVPSVIQEARKLSRRTGKQEAADGSHVLRPQKEEVLRLLNARIAETLESCSVGAAAGNGNSILS